MSVIYSIGALAREFGVTTRTIRFYQDEGLLSPARRDRTRLFDSRDRTRLKLILRGKRLGFSLAEIREIVDMYEAPPGEAGQLALLIARIEARRARLLRQREDIEVALRELDAVAARCAGRLVSLDRDPETDRDGDPRQDPDRDMGGEPDRESDSEPLGHRGRRGPAVVR